MNPGQNIHQAEQLGIKHEKEERMPLFLYHP